MRILLPPSEKKAPGGEPGTTMALEVLALPALSAARRECLSALAALAEDHEASMAALRLGPSGAGEVVKNRRLLDSPALPAIERFTGVLYDAFDVGTLSGRERRRAAERVLIHTAHLGPVGAEDALSDYRLSAGSTLPGFSLTRRWRAPVAAALAEIDGIVIDMRSKAYEALGPLAKHPQHAWLNVVRESAEGPRRALGHFNKSAKGRLARALAVAPRDFASLDEVCRWASDQGFALRQGAAGQLDLVAQ